MSGIAVLSDLGLTGSCAWRRNSGAQVTHRPRAQGSDEPGALALRGGLTFSTTTIQGFRA